MRTCVILNPIAGAVNDIAATQERLRHLGPERFCISQRPGDAEKFAREASNFDMIVSAGGDGTLNEVVNGIAQTGCNAALAVFPLGTGNDFARTLGVPSVLDSALDQIIAGRTRIQTELAKVIVGQSDVIEQLLIALFAGGHCLITGAPGLAKTLLVKSIAQIFHLKFQRIQFTPDLMPADITGTEILQESGGGRSMTFVPGPVFANMILADEINRTPPKTQAALLEAMQEHQVTAAGVRHPLPEPFFVLATQNPIEMEGTYPLPEAQLDRFLLKLRVRYPAIEELNAIIDRTTQSRPISVDRVMSGAKVLAFRELIREVPVAAHVRDLASGIVMATHPQWADAPEVTRRFVRYGASPRGAQALILGAKVRALAEGRYNVSADDLKALVAPALRHRVILNFAGEAAGIDIDTLLGPIVDSVESATTQAREPFVR